MKCPKGTKCDVCERADDKHRPEVTALPSGRVAKLCEECANSRFMLAEAERRMAKA